MHSKTTAPARRGSRGWSIAWAVCLGVTLLAAAVPFARAFYRVEIDYNEGWNIYNAATVASHMWLYPAKYGWTTVNYPMLSFAVFAQLHRFTHEYLFTARVVSLLSLLANGVLAGAIVHRLSRPHGNSLHPHANHPSPQPHDPFPQPQHPLPEPQDPFPQTQHPSPQPQHPLRRVDHPLFVIPEGNLWLPLQLRLPLPLQLRLPLPLPFPSPTRSPFLTFAIPQANPPHALQTVQARPPLPNRKAPILTGLFVVAIFCANADYYVGMDDPQMFAQVFFLAGLYVYLSWRRSFAAISFAALLFVVGGFIKHNPVDFPLAVLIDLLLLSRWRAVWFSLCGLALLALGLALHIHFGGPHFIDQLLAPRSWSLAKTFEQLRNGLGPILLPVGVAIYMAVRLWADRTKRITALLLALSLLLGGYFGGGNGVSVNSLFSAMLAVTLLVGLFLADLGNPDSSAAGSRSLTSRPAIAASLFLWLLIPLAISGNWNVVGAMRETRASQARFDRDVATMAAQPGPALCESLLRCYFAGKPYLYDPFNATRLVKLGKLNQDALVRSIADRKYAVIQLGVPLGDDASDDTRIEARIDARIDTVDSALRDRFTPEMLAAIRTNYVLLTQNADTAIYIPAPR